MTIHRKNADRFVTIMENAGAHVDFKVAGTGTVYVVVNGEFKVRFADHGECYCREDISVDPSGCTLRQAVAAAGRAMKIDVSAALAKMDRAGNATRTRKANDKARFEDREARRNAAVATWLAANAPADYETMKASKRHPFIMAALEATKGEWA